MKALKKVQKSISPFATGGGGFRFEWQVATYYVVAMLRGELARGLLAAPPGSVQLQELDSGRRVDIKVVTGNLERSLRLQVKHNIVFSDNEDFENVISECWSYFIKNDFNVDKDAVGVAIGEESNIQKVKKHLQGLLRLSLTSSSGRTFYNKAMGLKNEADYLRLFCKILRRVSGKKLCKEKVWDFMRCFRVISFDFSSSGSSSYYDCLNALVGLISNRDVSQAGLLFSYLYDKVSRYAQEGGELTVGNILAGLPASIHLSLTASEIEKLRSTKDLLRRHALRQLEKEKKSKRYIPDVFVETGKVKDMARFLAHPVLFFNKAIENIKRVDFTFLNRLLQKVSLNAVTITLDAEHTDLGNLLEIPARCSSLMSTVEEVKGEIDRIGKSHGGKLSDSVAPEKKYVASEIHHTVGAAARSISWRLDEVISELRMLSGGILLVIAPAAKGKTNFVCDFVENFMLVHSLPCIYLNGRELGSVDRTGLEQDIAKSVFGGENNGAFSDLLEDTRRLCMSEEKPLTVVIDGINEHLDISRFSQALERLIECLLKHDFVRLILTCRSEYFERRFQNLKQAIFSDKIHIIENMHKGMSDKHRGYMLYKYLQFFKIDCALSYKVQQKLENDPFLLRIFCEVYGDPQSNSFRTLPPQKDVYKDELFGEYLTRKMGAICDREIADTGLPFGAETPYRELLSKMVIYMVENRKFTGVPVNELVRGHRKPLNEIIYEDIAVCSQPSQPEILDSTAEIVRFTFDEFRDYLIANYLERVVFTKDPAKFDHLVDSLTNAGMLVAEGVSSFLFYASKKRRSDDLLRVLERKSWFEHVFASCVFSLQDEYLNDQDLSLVKKIFLKGFQYSLTITRSLIVRWDTEVYSKLNICLLFEIFDTLDIGLYNALVRPIFREDKLPRWGWPIGSLCEDIRKGITAENLRKNKQWQKLLELLLYLLDIRGNNWTQPAREALQELHLLNEELSFEIISRHIDTKSAFIASQIWDLLTSLVDYSAAIPKSFESRALAILRKPATNGTMNQDLQMAVTMFLDKIEGWSKKKTR